MRAAFSSLRIRVALLVLLATVPVLGLSIYNNLQQRRLAGERAGDEALRLVHLATGSEQEIIEGTRQLLIALAQLPEVRGDDGDACSALLARIRNQSQRYANLGVIDANGAVFCSALPFNGSIRLNDRTYFRQAIDEGIFSVGEYQIGRITGRPTINFGYPVMEGEQPRAVVFAALDLNWLNELASGLALQEGVVILSIDRRGVILTRYPGGERWIGQAPSSMPLIETILARGNEGTIEVEGLDGVRRLYAFAPLNGAGDAGVYVSAGIPTAVAYAQANRDLWRNLFALSLLTLVFLAAAWLVANRFVLRPVQALARAATRLSGGDLGARTGLSYDDSEVGRLAQTFDQMAGSLESRLRRLQALNAIDRAITSRYELPQTLEVVLDQVVSQLGVDAAAILLVNEDDGMLEFAAWRGFRSTAITRARFEPGEGFSGRVVRERRPLFVADLRAVPDMQAPLKASEGFISFCGVPLITEGQLHGVLSIYHRTQLALESEWKSFLEALALQAAIAIDNARLLRETQRLLEKTRAQARQVQQIVDSLPEGVVLLDPARRVLLANPLGRRHLAGLADAAVGDVLEALAQHPLQELLQPVSEDEPWHELALPGEKQIFEVASQPVLDEQGVGGWVLILRNVTEERERQEYIHTQGRLATVGQLAAGIAHDFNNIMSIILLYGQALSRHDEHPQRDEYLATIVRQAQRASSLIGQILDFSRAGSVERSRLELLPFVKEVTRLLQRIMPESIVISLEHDSRRYTIEADPTRLQQVLMNLAINARDAMPDGGRLTLALSSLTVGEGEPPPLPDIEPGQYVCLAIRDTGSGIPPDVLPHLFEPFFSTKPRGQGTGLGLAQVYGIIKQHQGAVGVQSEPGRGTTFTLNLPALGIEPAPPSPEARVSAIAGEGLVLLVEDNPSTRAAIAATLGDLGYQVLEAENGRQAISILRQHHPRIDLVLSDIVMPEMDGIVLQRTLQDAFPGVALVLMSGYPLQHVYDVSAESRQAAWLKKPFTANELARQLHDTLVGR